MPNIGILIPDQRVRVFISSTLGELRAERTAVGKIVKDDLDLHPVMFESGASPHPPRSRYRAMLQQSHIYVGIFWESYGWIADDMTISGMEDEYNCSEGKTRLIYIKSPSPGRQPQLAELLKRMENESSFCYKRFETVEELCQLVRSDIALVLSERFLLTETPSLLAGSDSQNGENGQQAPTPPSYLTALQTEMAARPQIERDTLRESIVTALNESGRAILLGDPGVGKTFLLGEIGEKHGGIYVSLRGKTTQQVFAHLVNHLRVRRGEFARALPSEEESRVWFESELSLAKDPVWFLLDHADQNPAAARALGEIEILSHRFLFASRPNALGGLGTATPLEVPPFSREQVITFLAVRGLGLSPGEAEKLVVASHGNALYLDFFARFQISPLPQGLADYQNELWKQLSPLQQEVAALVAHSLGAPTTRDICALTGSSLGETPLQIAQMLGQMPLLHGINGRWEIFHPYLQEHIIAQIAQMGVATHYHQLLGNYALEKGRVVATAFHFLRAGDERAQEHLLPAASVALLQGDWTRAEEFLNLALTMAKAEVDLRTEAETLHMLAQVYGETGRRPLSLQAVERCLELLDELQDPDARQMVELYAASLWIDQGQSQKAIATLQAIAADYHVEDERVEAGALSNLSYAYIQTGRGPQAVESAEKALEIFTRLGDKHGEKRALTNLSAAIGMADSGNWAAQKQWAERVIEKAIEWNDSRFKAAGLNHLARVQRREGDYVGAQKSSEEAVALCQQTGALDAELTNIANLGNALRDQGKTEEAERAYNEVLVRSSEAHLERSEAHAFELLARIRHDQERYQEAIELSQNALLVFERIDDVVRIGTTQDKLARAYFQSGQNQKAAEAYEASGIAYEKVQEWGDAADAFEEAAAQWNVCKQHEVASRCAFRGVRCALRDDDPGGASNALAQAADSHEEAGAMYSELLERFLSDSHSTNMAGFMTNFATFCKNAESEGSSRFRQGLKACVDALKTDFRTSVANALAIGIEQSTGLLSFKEVSELARSLTNNLQHFHFRSGSDEPHTWTVGLEGDAPFVLQFSTPSDDLVPHQLGTALSLIFLANREGIFELVREFGGSQEDGLEIQIVPQEELEARGIQFPADSSPPDVCASVTESRVPWGQPQPPTALIVEASYEARTDWSKNPGNKAFVWVLMNVWGAIAAHCVHKKRNDPGFAGKASRFCDRIFK